MSDVKMSDFFQFDIRIIQKRPEGPMYTGTGYSPVRKKTHIEQPRKNISRSKKKSTRIGGIAFIAGY